MRATPLMPWGASLLLLGCSPATAPSRAPVTAPSSAATLKAIPPVVAPEAPRVVPQESPSSWLAIGPRRPRTTTQHFDIEALPLAVWGKPPRGAGFSVDSRPDYVRVWLRSPTFAEVMISPSEPGSAAPGPFFTIFTGSSRWAGEVPACGLNAKRLARWEGIGTRGWTDASVPVEMATGDFDLHTCAMQPIVYVSARAAAIVPGYVYGIRVRSKAGNDPTTDTSSREELVIFLPRAALFSATIDPSTLLASNVGLFTHLTFPIERSSARSATVRITPASLGIWTRLRNTGHAIMSFEDNSAPHDGLLVGVDVVWEGDLKMGTLTFGLTPGRDAAPYKKLLSAAKTTLDGWPTGDAG